MGLKSSWVLLGMVVALTVGTGCTKENSTQEQANSGSDTKATSKGVGPISEVKLDPLSATLAAQGKATFQLKCIACHKIDEKFVGPALKGVTHRRQPEWIMNMILNPAEMTQKDPIARDLLAQHLTQMTFQNVSRNEARSILEFFRQNDSSVQ